MANLYFDAFLLLFGLQLTGVNHKVSQFRYAFPLRLVCQALDSMLISMPNAVRHAGSFACSLRLGYCQVVYLCLSALDLHKSGYRMNALQHHQKIKGHGEARKNIGVRAYFLLSHVNRSFRIRTSS